LKLTTKPGSLTEFEIELDGGIKGAIVRRNRGHRDVWTVIVNRRSSTPGSPMPSDMLHGHNAHNFETAFFWSMMITSDDIERWEEEFTANNQGGDND
jgi:hypothetical protein